MDHAPSEVLGERIFIDIASIKRENNKDMGYSKMFWLLAVDEYSRMKFSWFLNKKSELSGVMRDFIKKCKGHNIIIKYIRLNNARENKGFQKDANREGLGITFEFTAPNTPQQNSVVESAIRYLSACARSMMAHANFPMDIRKQLWTQAYNCATQLDVFLPYEHDKEGTITPFKCWFKKEAPFANYLHMFREAVSVTICSNIRNKAKDRGFTGVFVGYEFNHPPDTYRVWKPNTNHVILTRDVTYLKRMFFKKINPG